MARELSGLRLVVHTATDGAVNWLLDHGQTVEGVTASGVCVLADGVGVWLPAKRSALRDFMGY